MFGGQALSAAASQLDEGPLCCASPAEPGAVSRFDQAVRAASCPTGMNRRWFISTLGDEGDRQEHTGAPKARTPQAACGRRPEITNGCFVDANHETGEPEPRAALEKPDGRIWVGSASSRCSEAVAATAWLFSSRSYGRTTS